MIEERGRIVALEEGAVWIETLRQSACGSCAAQKGCGQSALARLSQKPMHVRALTNLTLQVDDEVIIGIPEDILLKSSLIVYLVPLLATLLAALLTQAFTSSEGWITLAGAAGMAAGFLWVRWHSARVRHDPRYHPQVLRRAVSASDKAALISCHTLPQEPATRA